MNNQATEINKLQQKDAASEGEELIDNVLKAMENNGSEHSVPQKNNGANVMDDVSVASSNTESSNLINNAIQKSSNKDILSSIEADEQAEKMIDDLVRRQQSKKGFFERVIDEAKDPFLVIILFVLFQSGMFTNLFTSLTSNYLGSEQTYTVLGIKGLMFGLVYYLFKKLLS